MASLVYTISHHLLCLNMTKVDTSTNWSLSYPCIAREKLNSDMLEAQPLCWEFNGDGPGMVMAPIVPRIQTITGFYSTLMSHNYNDNDDVASEGECME